MNTLGLEMFYQPSAIAAGRATSLQHAKRTGLLHIHHDVWKLLDNPLTAHEAQAKIEAAPRTFLIPRNHTAKRLYVHALSDFVAGDSKLLLANTPQQHAA